MSFIRLRVPLIDGESPGSFCSRLARANGRESMHAFCEDMGLLAAHVCYGAPAQLERLADLCGFDAALFRERSIFRDGMKIHVRGESVARCETSRYSFRCCPRCIEDDRAAPGTVGPWLRAAWSVALVRTCPVHAVMLEQVPVPRWMAEPHDVAVIVDCLRHEIVRRADVAATVEPSPLEDWMHGKLVGSRKAGFDPLDWLQFNSAVRLVEMVGATASRDGNVRISEMKDHDWLDAGHHGFEWLSEGKDGLLRFLDARFGTVTYKPETCKLGGGGMLGSFYLWLASMARSPAYAPLCELVREWAIDRVPLGPGDKFLGPVTRRKWHSIATVRKATGLHSQTVAKMFKAHGLLPSPGSPKGWELFDANECEDIVEKMDACLQRQHAREHIGATPVQWSKLVDNGVLKAIPMGSGRERIYAKADLDAFLASLLPAHPAHDMSGLMPLSAAVKKARSGFIIAIGMLRAQQLATVAFDPAGHGIDALRVRPSELRKHKPGKRPPRPGLSSRQAARRAGVGFKALLRLTAAGWMPSKPDIAYKGRNPSHRIEPQVAERFARDYIAIAKLQRMLGGERGAIRRSLEAAGLFPCFDVSVVGTRLYRRDAAIAALKPGDESQRDARAGE